METINHEHYVSLEVAKLLKQAGFDWGCSNWYSLDGSQWITDRETNNLSPENKKRFIHRPSLEVAQRWLRENKDFDINVLTDFDSVKRLYYVRYVVKDGHYKTYYISKNQSYIYFNTYEEAQEAGIKKALEIILDKLHQKRT